MANWCREIIAKSGLFHSADMVGAKGMGLLYPQLKRRVEWIIEQAARGKMRFDIFETYRSRELHGKYHRMGVSLVAGNGMHHSGEAADIVTKDGKGRWTWKAPRDERLKPGRLARRAGLVRGGGWRDMVDRPHVQPVPVGLQDENIEGRHTGLPSLAGSAESVCSSPCVVWPSMPKKQGQTLFLLAEKIGSVPIF